MYKLKSWLKRSMPVFLVVVFVVALCAIPASAELYLIDYNDYLTNVVVDGANDVCVVNFPLHWASWLVYPPYADVVIAHGSSSVSWTDPGRDDGTRTGIYLFPFGASYERSLDLSNIPVGTAVNCAIQIDNNAVAFNTPTVDVAVEYYDAEGSQISVGHGDYNFVYESGVLKIVNLVLDYPAGANSCNFRFDIAGFSSLVADTKVTMTLVDFELQFSISSLYRQQQLTGKTNDLLEKVNDQLADQNDKLDQIIDGTVAPVDPEGGDAVGDYNDFEEEIMNDMSSNFSEADGYITTAVEIITKYGTALLAVSHLFSIFWRFPFFSELVLVAFAFGMFATLLGVAFGAISAHDRKSVRANRGKGKGG